MNFGMFVIVSLIVHTKAANENRSHIPAHPNSTRADKMMKLAMRLLSNNEVKEDNKVEITLDILDASNFTVVLFCNDFLTTQQLFYQVSKRGFSMVTIDDSRPKINFHQLELDTKSNLFYLVFMASDKFSDAYVPSFIGNSGGSAPILYLTNHMNPKIVEGIITFHYYNVYVATMDKDGFEMYQKCLYCNEGQNSIVSANFWSKKNRFRREFSFTPYFKGSFYNTTLKVAYVNVSFAISGKYTKNNVLEYIGVEYDMLLDVSRMLHFNFLLVEPLDREWGKYSGGKWTGMVGRKS